MASADTRFNLDISANTSHSIEGNIDNAVSSAQTEVPLPPVSDILERPVTTHKTPTAPTVRSHARGFPTHKKRHPAAGPSSGYDADTLHSAARFISQQGAAGPEVHHSSNNKNGGSEKDSIDRENRQKLAAMSNEEIAKERQELFDGLSSSLIERLLKRSKIDDPNDSPAGSPVPSLGDEQNASTDNSMNRNRHPKAGAKTVRFEHSSASGDQGDRDDLQKARESSYNNDSSLEPSFVHTPVPQQPPSLDPSSPSFLEDLHRKYFASLPADPEKLEWMQTAQPDPSYSPTSQTIEIPNLRFNFNGSLISPRQAEQISVTEGLHHHGDAPRSAGYTVPELARLSRSSVAMQRCIAYQTLGRIMYRLGNGHFGAFDEKIPRGLWKCIGDGHVIETLVDEVEKEGGHASAKAHAKEALHLWRKSGGHKVRAE